jgi:hypothetical protein
LASNWWHGTTNPGLITFRTIFIAIVEHLTKLARSLTVPSAKTEIWGCHHLHPWILLKNSSGHCCVWWRTCAEFQWDSACFGRGLAGAKTKQVNPNEARATVFAPMSCNVC